MASQTINQTTKINAICAYMMILCSWMLLLNKDNPNLNNDFVKNHVKNSMFFHLIFFVVYIVFISFGVFGGIYIFQISLDKIITSSVFLLNLGVMLFFMNKTYKGDDSKVIQTFSSRGEEKNKINLLDINGDQNIDEKDKLTILSSLIPFWGFFIFPSYKNNKLISNLDKLNLIYTVFIVLAFVLSGVNTASLLILIAIIFIVFSGINLFARNSIISINLEKIPNPYQKLVLIRTSFKYISLYLKKEFKGFNKIKSEILNSDLEDEKSQKEILSKSKEPKLSKYLIYLALINLVFLFIKNTKYKIHIQNGVIITLIFVIFSLTGLFKLNLFTLMMISSGAGNLYSGNLTYKMPFINNIYQILSKIFGIIGFGAKKVNETRKLDINESLKVSEKDNS